MDKTRLTKDYGLNIYLCEGDEEDGVDTGWWEIAIYEIATYPDSEQEVDYRRAGNIVLKQEEVETLSLGENEDISTSVEEFFQEYENIPSRVSQLLLDLPEYEMEVFGSK
jgi:hypothetical protein